MASTVEIISNQLGSSMIHNAATEQTLQEMLATIRLIEGSIQNGTGNTPNIAANSALRRDTKQASEFIGKVGQGFGKLFGILNSAGKTGTSFIEKITAGETKMSSYADALNQNFIKQLPLVGGALGVLGSKITSTLSVFEVWVEEYERTAKVGASFYNDITRLRMSAAKSRLDLDTYSRIIIDNSDKLLAWGGTVTSGSEEFAEFNRLIKEGNSYAVRELSKLGLTNETMSEGIMRYMNEVLTGHRSQQFTNELLQKDFVNYIKHYDRYTKLSGLTAEQLQERQARASQDAMYRIRINQISDSNTRTKLTMALTAATHEYGEVGAEIFRSLEQNMEPQSEAAQLQLSLFPHMREYIDNLIKSSRDRAVSSDKMLELTKEESVKAAWANRNILAYNENLVVGAAAKIDSFNQITDALSRPAERVSQMGNIHKQTAEMYRESFDLADEEAGQVDGITEMIRSFKFAIQEFKNNFTIAIIPAVVGLSRALSENGVAARIEEFGKYLNLLVTDGIPKLFSYFTYLYKEGWPLIRQILDYFVDNTIPVLLSTMNNSIEDWIKKHTPQILGDFLTWKPLSIIDRLLDEDFTVEERSNANRAILRRYLSESNPYLDPFKVDGHYVYPKDINGKYFGWDNPDLKGVPTKAYKSNDQRILEHLNRRSRRITSPSGKFLFEEINPLQLSTLNQLLAKDTPFAINAPGGLRNLNSNSFNNLTDNERRQWFNDVPVFTPKYIDFMNELRASGQYQGYNTGTLGKLGKLFGNFGSGTPVELHGKEAVVTPSQLGSIIQGKDQVLMTNFLKTLNTNINSIITLTRNEITIERNKLDAHKNTMLT